MASDLPKRFLFTLSLYALIAYLALSSWALVRLFTDRASVHAVSEATQRPLLASSAQSASATDGGDVSFVFRRLARPQDQFIPFPYTFLQKPTPSKPRETRLNELGFRGEEIAGFRSRHPKDRVVVVVGGSAAFSTTIARDCLTFPALLEEMLGRDPSLASPGRRFRVVNLALPSAHVLNETVCYLLFGEALRPEVVIAHDGFNDLLGGQIVDRRLLEQYAMTYYKFLYEDWAKILSDAGSGRPVSILPLDQRPPVVPENDPEAIVLAYHERLLQLQSVVQASGAAFVSGLQPFSGSKGMLSEREEQRIAGYMRFYAHVYANMGRLYALYLKRFGSDRRLCHFLDFHGIFRKLGRDQTVFADFVHCTEDGDRIIAQEYTKKLREVLAPVVRIGRD